MATIHIELQVYNLFLKKKKRKLILTLIVNSFEPTVCGSLNRGKVIETIEIDKLGIKVKYKNGLNYQNVVKASITLTRFLGVGSVAGVLSIYGRNQKFQFTAFTFKLRPFSDVQEEFIDSFFS